AEKTGLDRLGVGRAEVGEVGEQVGVGFEACRGDLAVAQPGPPVAVDVLDGPAAVGVEGRLGAVVAQDVGQHLQGGVGGLLGRVAGLFRDLGPRLEVVGHVVGGLPGVVPVLFPVGVDERVEGGVPAAVHLLQGAVGPAAADRGPDADLRAGEEHAGGDL